MRTPLCLDDEKSTTQHFKAELGHYITGMVSKTFTIPFCVTWNWNAFLQLQFPIRKIIREINVDVPQSTQHSETLLTYCTF